MAQNKVQFNLKNVHYAVITDNNGTITYATPVALKGAVSLTLEAQNGETKFYADGLVYYSSNLTSAYQGDLEVARINDAFFTSVFGFSSSTNSLLIENVTTEPKRFALLFQVDGDSESEYHVFYDCVASKPSISAATLEASKDPQTQTISITCNPLSTGVIRGRTTEATTATVKSGWFNTVYTD